MIQQDTTCHDAVTELLPWYVNDTLDDAERSLVREHIGICGDCREDVELLSRVERAVRNESPAPLVPAPRTEKLLAALDMHGRRRTPNNHWRWLAAASIVAIVGLTSMLVWQRNDGIKSPTRFETATSAPATNAINYVVEIQFAGGVSAESRMAFFDSLETRDTVRPANNGAYRVTLALGSMSLTDLENTIQVIESRPEISTAEVVAVQLPVE